MQAQPPDPSSAEPSQDGPAPEAVSESEQPGFLQRLFRRRGSPDAEPQEQPEETETSPRITLSQEELDKRIQAETDRREAKRANDAKAAERRKLRDEDPWAFAEQERQAEKVAEQDAGTTALLSNLGATHDRFTLDPLVEQLPEAERQRILGLQGAGSGLEGRKLIVTEGLKALEKHWRAEGAKDAEDRLRRNPAFRKQVLNEFRRGLTEPEFLGSGAPSAADRSVSNLLREQIRARH